MNVGNRYLLVHEIDGKILGFMTFLDQDDHLRLDLIERNELIEESHSMESNLMVFPEIIAGNFGYSRTSITKHDKMEGNWIFRISCLLVNTQTS